MASHVARDQIESPQSGLTRCAAAFSARVAWFGALALSLLLPLVAAAQSAGSAAMPEARVASSETLPVQVKVADFGREASSSETMHLADWVVGSADNANLPFMIVDKVNARVFLFDGQGQIKGTTSVLLGLAVGDDSVPGIGQRKLSTIRPEERTTPAGRFVASLDRDIHGKEILWVDYDTAISLHAVVKGTPKERRAERLASASVLDKRISYGCINVPVSFYETLVSPTFKGTNGIVYILPETRSAAQVFGSYDIQGASRQQALSTAMQATQSAQPTQTVAK